MFKNTFLKNCLYTYYTAKTVRQSICVYVAIFSGDFKQLKLTRLCQTFLYHFIYLNNLLQACVISMQNKPFTFAYVPFLCTNILPGLHSAFSVQN